MDLCSNIQLKETVTVHVLGHGENTRMEEMLRLLLNLDSYLILYKATDKCLVILLS